MKRLIIAMAMLGASLASVGSQAQTNVQIQIGQPGFYGTIELGDFRRPPVVYAQPVIIERHARLAPEPVYLRVPPGHMKKWGKHCARYNACGRQVYFVRDDWYTNTYAPRYRQARGGQDRYEQRSEVRYDERRDKHENKHENKHDKHENKHDNKHHGKGHGNGKH